MIVWGKLFAHTSVDSMSSKHEIEHLIMIGSDFLVVFCNFIILNTNKNKTCSSSILHSRSALPKIELTLSLLEVRVKYC